ncbi:hypothetical protein HK104_009793 [Borealophlyctis nickersoniae]|nr:hypothetical protein HK104_009793 [Borealophlyctis nickersoniae]
MTTDQVILNVGGTSFTTTKSTLLRHPNSTLAALVRFDQDVTPNMSESTSVTPNPKVFLDEDPGVCTTPNTYIPTTLRCSKWSLTYLRHGILAMPAKGEPSLAEVEAVGEYLNLPGLVQKAREAAGPTVIYKAVCVYNGGRFEFPLASPDAFEWIKNLSMVAHLERVSAQFPAHQLVGKPAGSGVDWCLRDGSNSNVYNNGLMLGSSTWILMEGRKRSGGAVQLPVVL